LVLTDAAATMPPGNCVLVVVTCDSLVVNVDAAAGAAVLEQLLHRGGGQPRVCQGHGRAGGGCRSQVAAIYATSLTAAGGVDGVNQGSVCAADSRSR
jgi:hypothetical protein